MIPLAVNRQVTFSTFYFGTIVSNSLEEAVHNQCLRYTALYYLVVVKGR